MLLNIYLIWHNEILLRGSYAAISDCDKATKKQAYVIQWHVYTAFCCLRIKFLNGIFTVCQFSKEKVLVNLIFREQIILKCQIDNKL